MANDDLDPHPGYDCCGTCVFHMPLNPIFCDHANENPLRCPCSQGCYCKTHTCASKPEAEQDIYDAVREFRDDQALKDYQEGKLVHKDDVIARIKELRDQWNRISNESPDPQEAVCNLWKSRAASDIIYDLTHWKPTNL